MKRYKTKDLKYFIASSEKKYLNKQDYLLIKNLYENTMPGTKVIAPSSPEKIAIERLRITNKILTDMDKIARQSAKIFGVELDYLKQKTQKIDVTLKRQFIWCLALESIEINSDFSISENLICTILSDYFNLSRATCFHGTYSVRLKFKKEYADFKNEYEKRFNTKVAA